MLDSLGVNAKTQIPALGEPITGSDVRAYGWLLPATLISCSSILSGRRADLTARCGWMDGAKSPVVGKAWKMEALELEEKMTATKIKR
jgi:hypothetical protein